MLTVGGTAIESGRGPARATQITWPPASLDASLVAEPGLALRETGPWALQRLFARGRLQASPKAGRQLLSFDASPGTLAYEVGAAGTAPFAPGLFTDFRCPGRAMTVAAGFFGKIPTRGDFVRHGLPSDLVRGLDEWWQAVLPASRQVLGEAWVEAWMEAPIWRFLLPPGCCGAGPVAGLWLPSTDKAGRLFPLTIAVTARNWRELSMQGGFLDAAETIGLDAVELDVEPDALAAAIVAAAAATEVALLEPRAATWWTDGSRLVAPARVVLPTMPDGAAFAAMLRDEVTAT